MGLLPRRFLNLIVPGCTPGVKSLRRIDLTPLQLFYQVGSAPAPEPAGGQDAISRPSALEMETVPFPGPSFTFRALNKEWRMDCFPLADYSECKLICADQSGRGFVFDLDSPKVCTIPALRKPWLMQPISVFVHKPHIDGNLRNDSNGSSLFLMEKVPQPEASRGDCSVYYRAQESEQFVGFINHCTDSPGVAKSWQCHLLPPPPFVRETYRWSNNCPKITAYGVIGGGSHVCISVDGIGTYCLNTESLTWSQAGEWTLPFHGKVEYVPELKLWFGLSAGGAGHLAAADLSGMLLGSSSQPPQRLVGGPWKELVDLPEEWKECKDPQFLSLGSGRFCIARFFNEAGPPSDVVAHKNFTVLTGVEVAKGEGGTRELELRMIPHRSRRVNDASIETLF